jgi:hypothetical protein
LSAGDNRWLVRPIVVAQFGPAFMFSGVAIALRAYFVLLVTSGLALVFAASGALRSRRPSG